MTAGLLTATAAPAAAATSYGPLCNYIVGDFNACITINYAGGGLWNVSLGQDDYMSVAQADRIIAHGSSMFATLLGERSGRFLGYVPLVTGSPVSGTNPEGLFADFYGTNINLNEFSARTGSLPRSPTSTLTPTRGSPTAPARSWARSSLLPRTFTTGRVSRWR